MLTVAGMSRIAWVVQNNETGGWSFVGNPTEVDVPADGQVPIAADFTATGQFVLYYDAADTNFKDYSGQVTIV